LRPPSRDFFGTVVQLAAQICERAEPRQVLLSRVVADLCSGKSLDISHHSETMLKGFAEPTALFEVRNS
jgi:class 3 adenylate cyclase